MEFTDFLALDIFLYGATEKVPVAPAAETGTNKEYTPATLDI
jgi:hypothetical protein